MNRQHYWFKHPQPVPTNDISNMDRRPVLPVLKYLCNSTFSAADLLSEVLDGSREKVISELVHVKQMFSVHRLLQGIDLQPHLAV